MLKIAQYREIVVTGSPPISAQEKMSKRCDFSVKLLLRAEISVQAQSLLHLTKEVPLLITELDDDKILIKKLDRNEIEKRLRDELKDLDIDMIASEVRTEVNEEARKKYAAILD